MRGLAFVSVVAAGTGVDLTIHAGLVIASGWHILTIQRERRAHWRDRLYRFLGPRRGVGSCPARKSVRCCQSNANRSPHDAGRPLRAGALTLGMVGKWAIHPGQIAPAVDAFSPAQKDIDFAREIIRVYRKAEAEGIGSVGHKGVMVDAASARLFQNVVNRAEMMGL